MQFGVYIQGIQKFIPTHSTTKFLDKHLDGNVHLQSFH